MIIKFGSKSLGEFGLIFSDGMDSKFDRPLANAFLPQMPIITQAIGDHISLRTDLGSTDRISPIV